MTQTSGGSPAANEVASLRRWSGWEGTASVLILTPGLASWKPLATSTKALDSAGSPKTRKLSWPLRAACVGGAEVAVGASLEAGVLVAAPSGAEVAAAVGSTTGVGVGVPVSQAPNNIV